MSLPIGVSVRINDRYWQQELIGRTGIVSEPPSGIVLAPGVVWLELDVVEWNTDVVDGAEVDEEYLEILPIA